MTGNLKTSPFAQTQMQKAKGKADKGSRCLLLYAAPHHPQKSFHKEKNFPAKNEKLVKFSSTISHVFQLPSQWTYLWQLSGQKLSKILFPPKNKKINLQKSSRAHLVECAADCWMIVNETFSSFAGSEWNFLCLVFVVVLMCCEARLSPISSFGRKLSARLCLSRIFTKQLAWKLWFVATDFGT